MPQYEPPLFLQQLGLGRTRRQALENFADRVPTEAVRDFVGTVIQSEEKGNPLAEVLKLQAEAMRLQRSVSGASGSAAVSSFAADFGAA